MASSKRTISSTPAAANVNLYCAQCEAQIGIFDNEWIRLTSSYARSKEKGTHFGTEVGQRIQVVPGGPLPRTAEGCEMAEVFCRKCSNMVGQYCKKAPDASKQFLVDQYFYKLSRTFLKHSKTNMRVEPVFGYSPDVSRSTPGARLSMGLRTSMTPTSRWMNTPLREASRTPSIQTATRSALRDQQSSSLPCEKPLPSPSYGTDEHFGASQQAMDILKKELAAQNSMLKEHSTRLKSQSSQISDQEACLRDHDARMEDQENCIRAQATRILEQEDTIEDQHRALERYDEQLNTLRQQLSQLRHLIDTSHNTQVQEARSSNLTQRTEAGQIDFVGSFESLVRAMKEAQTTTHEAQLLREQNQNLQNRLDSILGAVSVVPDSDAGGEGSLQPSPRGAQILGKRKRNTPNSKDSSLRPTESPIANERRLVRFDEQGLSQLPTPQSLQNHVSPVEHSGAKSSAQQAAGGKLAQDGFDQRNRGAERSLGSVNALLDEAMDDSGPSGLLLPVGVSVGHDQGDTTTPAHKTVAQPTLIQTLHSLPDPVSEVTALDASSTAQEDSEQPSRMNTRSSARVARHGKNTSNQDLAKSSHRVQSNVDSSMLTDPSQQRRSPIMEETQSHLPSVQAAGRVLGINLGPLQTLHQAFVGQPVSNQLAASTTLPQPTSTHLPTSSSSTIQPSFDAENAQHRNPEQTELHTVDQGLNQPAAALDTTQQITAPSVVVVEDNSMYDSNVDFSDDDHDDDADCTEVLKDSTDQTSNRRVTDTWIDRDMRSMAPEPSKRRRKTASDTGPKYLTLDRVHIATPQMWTDAISKGQEPKMTKPPYINRRQLDLHNELRTLGLAEWIPRNKKSKEYREIVAAARSRYRDARLAQALQESGLSHQRASPLDEFGQMHELPDLVSNDQVLSPLDDPRATHALPNDLIAGDENSPEAQPAQETGSDMEARETQKDHEAPRMTRARARRSSASVDASLENPGEATRVATDTGRSSKDFTSDGRSTRRRKSEMQTSVMIAPDARQSAAVAQESTTSTDGNLREATAPSDAQQSSSIIKKGRGRPRKGQGPVATVANNAKLVQERATPVESPPGGHADSAVHMSASLPGSIPDPQERQKLLESMRSRAQQKEEAIAARDLMAKEAMEAMEREEL